MVIDVHVHAVDPKASTKGTEWWVEEIYQTHRYIYDEQGQRQKRPASRIYTPDLIRNMDKAGVDKSCIMTSDHRRVNPPPRIAPYTSNNYIGKLLQEYPDRLIGIAGYDPFRGGPYDAVKELERCIQELGMSGMKLYPSYDNFHPYDERLFPLYEKAIEFDIPLTFHMGFTGTVTAMMKYQFPHLLDEVGIRYRDLKVVVAHIGYPWFDECICLVGKHSNFCVDVAALCTLPTETLIRTLLTIRDMVGLDRVLFGSEQFLCEPTFYVKVFRNINQNARKLGLPEIDDEDIDKILGLNAAKLYKVET